MHLKGTMKKSAQAIRTFLVAASAPLLLAQPAQAIASGQHLPDIGTAGLSALTLEKERDVGDQAMRQIRATYPMLGDPVLQEYLEHLGYRLVTSGSKPIHPFTFFLINQPSINAFAFFGGHVGVHTGLFMAAANESELASVLAHEIAHVNQRHLARHIEHNMQMQPATLGATLGAILLTILAPQAGIAALQTSMAASQQMAINFTRKHESEADRIGMQNLVAAGFDPYSMPSFFGKLAAKYRFASKPPAFLMTHPFPENRVADAQLRAQQFPSQAHPVSIDFQFAKARIQVRYGNLSAIQSVDKYKFELERPDFNHKDALRYGLALAYLQAEQADDANKTIAPLLAKYPRNLFVLDAITDIEMALNHQQAAIQRLQGFYQYMPENQVIALNYANVLLKQSQHDQAIDILKQYRITAPEDMTALGLLQDAYSKAGLIGQQYSTRADSLALMGRYEQAIAMLERASRSISPKQRIEQTKIEAKKNQFRKELQRLKTSR